MSIYGSLYSGISGLGANGMALSVIGDNIANINTIGFKKSRATFQDMMAYPVIGAGQISMIGRGAMLEDVTQEFNQGSFVNTGNGLDLAINGNGFFVVNGNVGGQVSNFFTRDGQFQIDKNGYMINVGGLKLQGYQANSEGGIASELSDLCFKDLSSPVRKTAEIAVAANLDAAAEVLQAPSAPFDPADPANTSNFSTVITIYDSQGASHDLSIYYNKTADNAWEWHAMASDDSSSTVIEGALGFDTEGRLAAMTTTNPAATFTFSGAAAQNVSFDFGDPISDGGTGLLGITQFSSTSSISSQNQDGYPRGELQGLVVDAEGLVTGSFTNGKKRVLGQIAVASFEGMGLRRMGSNLWQATTESGDPAIGNAGAGGRGGISSSVLEQSNVDMAAEFVNMIVAQRGYQANSRTITTADMLLQETLNMKR